MDETFHYLKTPHYHQVKSSQKIQKSVPKKSFIKKECLTKSREGLG